MGFGIGSVLGFASGLKAPPRFEGSGTLGEAGKVRGNIDDLMDLYSRLIDAAGSGGGDFLKDIFAKEFANFSVPFRARSQSSRVRTVEDLKRSGVTDPVAIARILSDQDRGFASIEAQNTRKLSTSQALRQEQFPFKVGALVEPGVSRQQGAHFREAKLTHESEVRRTEFENQKKRDNAAAFQNLAEMGLNIYTGGGFGAAKGLLGGGKGGGASRSGGGSIASGGGFDFLDEEFGGGFQPRFSSGFSGATSSFGNEFLSDFS